MFLHLLIFRVNEGEVGALVGQVRAVDADIGQNAVLTYSIKDPESLFRVEEDTGRLFTRGKLDFETSNLVYVSVTARDGAKEAREVEVDLKNAGLDAEAAEIQRLRKGLESGTMTGKELEAAAKRAHALSAAANRFQAPAVGPAALRSAAMGAGTAGPTAEFQGQSLRGDVGGGGSQCDAEDRGTAGQRGVLDAGATKGRHSRRGRDGAGRRGASPADQPGDAVDERVDERCDQHRDGDDHRGVDHRALDAATKPRAVPSRSMMALATPSKKAASLPGRPATCTKSSAMRASSRGPSAGIRRSSSV